MDLPRSGTVRSLRPPEPLEWLETQGIDACDLDVRVEVRQILREGAKLAPGHPAVLAVTAALARVDGDIPRSIKWYHRALAANPAPNLRAAVLEDLIALEFARRELETSVTDTPIAMALADHPHHVGLRSVRAMLRAQQGERQAAIDDIEDVIDRSSLLPYVARARTLVRASVAAYFLGDYGQCQRLGIEAVEIARRCGANRLAARAFFQLYIYARIVVRDASMALVYATEGAVAATLAEDQDVKQLMLSLQYVLEAESGNKLRASDLQTMLKREQHVPGYQGFLLGVADALLASWDDNWRVAKSALEATKVPSSEAGGVALRNALLALIEAALGNSRAATRAAGSAAQHSRTHRHEPLHNLHNQHLARVLAAAALMFVGQARRGARYLATREFQQGAPENIKALALTIDTGRVDDLRENAPDIYGYALLLSAVRRKLYSQDEARLTSREIEVLILRSQGVKANDIARQHGVVRDTIMKRQQSAVAKLGVPNIIAAISEARRRGLIS